MADDLTLTVRVRDATRAPFAAINSRLRTLQARLRLASNESDRFGRLNRHLRDSEARLRTAAASSSRFGRALRGAAGGMSRLQRVVTAAGTHTNRILRRMSDEVGRLRRGIDGAHGDGSRMVAMFWRMGQRIKQNTRWMAILIATLLLIGPVAQLLGVLLVTVLGAAFVALGAFALKGNADVKTAFQDMKSTLGSVVREAALPMKDGLVSAMNQVGNAAREMQPLLTTAFAATGPLIEDMTRGITNLFALALPGFTIALQNSGGAMEGFRVGMGMIGKGFGEMMRIITEGNDDELREAWVVLGNELENVLESLGEFISTALNSETATFLMIGVFRTFTGALNLVAGALKVLDTIFGDLFREVINGVVGVANLSGEAVNVATAFGDAGKSAAQLETELAAVNKQIAALENDKVKGAGPAGDMGPQQEKINELLKKRASLEGALAAASAGAAAANEKEAESVRTLVDAMLKLNGQNLSSLDARAAMEEAIDSSAEGIGKLSNALSMNKGQLNLNSAAAQEAYAKISELASATNEATKKSLEANEPWAQTEANWKRGRDALVGLIDNLGLSAGQARILADSLLDIPEPTVSIKMQKEEAVAQLTAFNQAVKNSPGTKSVTLKTLSATAIKVLESFGFKVKNLKDGSVKVTAKTGGALSSLNDLQGRVNRMHGKSLPISVYLAPSRHDQDANGVPDMIQARRSGGVTGFARGGLVGAANGGIRSRRTLVGEQGPELVDLAPGSRVRSNPDSRRLSGVGVPGGGGGENQPIVIQLSIAGRDFGEIVVDAARKQIRTRGGNVQAVLGQRRTGS